MSEIKTPLTVELDDGRRFPVPSGPDPAQKAKSLVSRGSVPEVLKDGSLIVYPIHRVKAIHVGRPPW